MKVSVSFITSKYKEKETIKKINETDAEYIHLDIMDGKFVKNKNYSFSEIVKFLENNTKKIDCHLMVSNPEKYIDNYATLDIDYLTFHFEAVKYPEKVIELIKNYGLKVGISLKPKTKVNKIKHLLPLIDQVLVMSVEPGKGGQEFILETLTKISELNELRTINNYNYIISVDGGINQDNINLIKELRADIVVVGSYVCLSDDYQESIEKLR